MSEKKVIKRNDWVSKFTLIGKPVINDYSFKINERSEKSKWVYNSMNLGIDCGDAFGTVWAECMGGYSEENENRIYAHGKNESGRDDYEKQIVVSWEDRNNEDILEEIGDSSFFVCGLEKTDKDKVYYKNFLSPYDAIAYIKEHLSDDMVVVVKGNLKYSEYNGNVQVRKNITYIGLAIDNKTKDFVAPDKFKAVFTQSILIDKDSASLKNIDKDKGVMFVDAKVLDYLKEKDGIEVKGQYPYNKQFDFPMDFSNQAQCKKIMDKLFKVKKAVTQINFDGEFIEGGSVVTATWDDVPDDIKDLVDMGVYSKEEALAKCTSNGNRERRMVLKRPSIKMVGDDDNKVPVLSIYPERYAEEDLVLDYLYQNKNDDEPPFNADEESDSDDSMSWLNAL